MKKKHFSTCSASFLPSPSSPSLSCLIFTLVHHSPSLFLFSSFLFPSFHNLLPPFSISFRTASLSVSPFRTKEGETSADNDLMYGPVMSLVGGQTPLFPRATRNRLHGSIGLSTKESRKHEIFSPKEDSAVLVVYIFCFYIQSTRILI